MGCADPPLLRGVEGTTISVLDSTENEVDESSMPQMHWPSSGLFPSAPGSGIGGGCNPSGSPSGTNVATVLNKQLMNVVTFGARS